MKQWPDEKLIEILSPVEATSKLRIPAPPTTKKHTWVVLSKFVRFVEMSCVLVRLSD